MDQHDIGEDGEPRRRWAMLARLALVQLLVMGVWFSASAVVPQLRLAWGLSGVAAAWLTMAVQLGFVLGAVGSAVANLPDRVPGPRLIAACGLGAALGTAAIPLLEPPVWGVIALRLSTGAFLAGVYPPGMRLASTWTARGRGLAIGLLVGAITLGSALPHLGNAVTGGGMPPWRGVLLGAAGLALAGSLLSLLALRTGPLLARRAPFDWTRVGHSFKDPPLRLANLGYLGHMWELYAMWTWVPVLLMDSYAGAGWSLSGARWAGFGAVAAGALGSLLAGQQADRRGRTLVAGSSLAISGACCLVAGGLAAHPGWLTALCLVWGFAVVADSAQFSAAITELADPRYVGTALTVQTSLGFLLTMASIQLVPALVERAGPAGAFGWLAVGPAVGLVAMARLRARPEAVAMAGGRR